MAEKRTKSKGGLFKKESTPKAAEPKAKAPAKKAQPAKKAAPTKKKPNTFPTPEEYEAELQAKVEERNAKATSKKSSYVDVQAKMETDEVKAVVEKHMPPSSHTLTAVAQNSCEVKRDAKGILTYSVKFYGKSATEAVLGAVSMLERLEANLFEYEKKNKKKPQEVGKP